MIARTALYGWIALLGFTFTNAFGADLSAVTPLPRAHAHNDYEHTRPLFDALDNGFCSIEPDIYLVDGQLLVAHDRDKTTPERTLQRLYLDPLRKRIHQNGGRVYKGGPPVVLLIDIKSEATSTYRALRKVLEQYADIFTRFSGQEIQTNALVAIISGNRAPELLAAERVRFAALDGRPADLDGHTSTALFPLISEDWNKLFTWRGTGPLPDGERARLEAFTAKAHTQGRKVRFWGAPDTPQVWTEFLRGGVDLLNADDLPRLRQFLLRFDFTPEK